MKTDPGPMGIAPKLLPYVFPPLAAALLLQILAPGLIGFSGPLRGIFFAAGIWWAGLGLAFYADLAVRLLRALAAKRLATRGRLHPGRHHRRSARGRLALADTGRLPAGRLVQHRRHQQAGRPRLLHRRRGLLHAHRARAAEAGRGR